MAVKNATVGTCESTSDFCLAESCSDTTVGIDCICEVAGEQVAFPTDCMQVILIGACAVNTGRRRPSDVVLNHRPPLPPQSAVLEVPVPSKNVLTYIVPKPRNETNEFILANVCVAYDRLQFKTFLYDSSTLICGTDRRASHR